MFSCKVIVVIALFNLIASNLAKSDDKQNESKGSDIDSERYKYKTPLTFKVFKTAENNQSISKPAKNTSFICQNFISPTLVIPKKFFYLFRQNSSWVKGDYIDLDKMPYVPGNISMVHKFTVTTTKKYRHLYGNGIPNHPMGVFPIQPGSEAYNIYSQLEAQGYPNAAAIPVYPYNLTVYLPRNPKVNPNPTCLGALQSLITGVSTQTGATWHLEVAVAGKDPSTYQGVDPSDALPLDLCFGHPYYGQYHYHTYSWKCFPNQGLDPHKHSPIYGYAMDGFGIYGPRSLDGKLVTNEDLDECHGHSHKVMWDGKETNIYHYHLNNEYPYSVGCYRGTPYFVGNSPASLTENHSDFEKELEKTLSHQDKLRMYEEFIAQGDMSKLEDRILMGV